MRIPSKHDSGNRDKPGKDLVWTLEGISNRVEAIQFLMLFEDTFPVYHPYMEQIYFRYSFVIPPRSNQVIVEPSFQLHERLCKVSEDDFGPRRMHIIPGDVVGKSGLYMRSLRQGRGRYTRTQINKLGTAIKALHFEATLKGELVIPVFSKQAIREYDEGMPNMELSLYDLQSNKNLSPFVRDAIVSAVFERIVALNFCDSPA